MSAAENSTDASSDCSSVATTASTVSDITENNSSYRYMRFKICPGKRRNSKLLYTLDEQQYYSFNSKNKNCEAYKCVECNSRVHLRVDGICIQKNKYSEHKHAKKGKLEENLNILNEVKAKCADLSTLINERKQSVRDVFYSVLSKYPDVQMDFFRHERALQMIRNKSLPKNPIETSDIQKMFEREDIMSLLGKTKDGELFFDGVLEGNDHSACFFSSKKSMKIFEAVPFGERQMMIDGTFDVVPTGSFKQLLVIHAVYMGKVSILSLEHGTKLRIFNLFFILDVHIFSPNNLYIFVLILFLLSGFSDNICFDEQKDS